MRSLLIAVVLSVLFVGCKTQEPAACMSFEKKQSEALNFVKQCVQRVKRQDITVLQVVTDANILCDVEAKLKRQGNGAINWDESFGKLSQLTNEQIARLDTEVLLLKHPMRVSKVMLTDKRQPTEREIEGIYMRFEANIVPPYRKLFRDQDDIGFGVYIIEGKNYWEPFGW